MYIRIMDNISSSLAPPPIQQQQKKKKRISAPPQQFQKQTKENGGNLTPFKKGVITNKRGRPIGALSMKEKLKKMFVEKGATEFTNTIWELCIKDKNVRMIECVLKIAGALDQTPISLNVNNNNLSIIPQAIIDSAKRIIAIENGEDEVVDDIEEIKVGNNNNINISSSSSSPADIEKAKRILLQQTEEKEYNSDNNQTRQ